MIYQELTGEIIGCAVEVHFSTDEIKAGTEIEDVHLAQAINYPEASCYPVELPINFGSESFQFKKRYNKNFPQNQIKSYGPSFCCRPHDGE